MNYMSLINEDDTSNVNIFDGVLDDSNDNKLNTDEAIFLQKQGIHYLYLGDHVKYDQRYQHIDAIKFPVVYDKCVYLLAYGTNTVYVLPHYILMKHQWFSNLLDTTKFSTNFVKTPFGNILLPLELPNPGHLNLLTQKLLKGHIGSYVSEKEKKHIQKLFDYVCTDLD
jgi:hypothetical protein